MHVCVYKHTYIHIYTYLTQTCAKEGWVKCKPQVCALVKHTGLLIHETEPGTALFGMYETMRPYNHQPCHCPPDWTGLRTNRVKQMAKLNEICYEAVIEQVRKGLQPLSCFWSCYLADTHEQTSSAFVKRKHIEAEAKKVHIRNSSLP